MSSILTNNGAMTALRSLQNTNSALGTTQNRVSTGMKVANAGDNAARWAVAATMKTDASAYGTLAEMHGVALAAVQLGIDNIETMVGIYEKVKGKAAELEEATANSNTDAKAAAEAEILVLQTAATAIAEESSFAGINFLDGSALTYTVKSNMDTGTAGVTGVDVGALATVSTTVLADTAIDSLKSAGRALGAGKQSLEARQTFMKNMNDALKAGAGALVDADMTEESARLSALQVQQQLGAQAMSIANQAPQVLLSLFR